MLVLKTLPPEPMHRGGGGMTWSTLIRQTHRWMSVLFTLAVIVTAIALARENPVIWVSYVPLFPLALLFLTGLYLYALPYSIRWRDRAPATRLNLRVGDA